MSNNYFQFKQFTIWQDRCAMKVTTDGCLLGAIAATEIRDRGYCQVLDIGAGTGLLSLMIAQENESALIDGIEIEAAAYNQAKENVSASPWHKRIMMQQADVLHFDPSCRYDFIVSNPPFYEQQLSSPDMGRQLAHHSSGLTLQQLFQQAQKLLREDGRFLVLLPFYRTEEAVAIANATGFFTEKQWLVKQTPKHSFFRTIICFSQNESCSISHLEIIIRDETGNYSESFSELLQNFYLHL